MKRIRNVFGKDCGKSFYDDTSVSDTSVLSAYLGIKAPAETKTVGDIVFNDGSATPYRSIEKLSNAQRMGAAAFIFYTGRACSDNNKFRILGVGLKISKEAKQWCRYDLSADYAAAHNVNISTMQESKRNGSDNLLKIGSLLGLKDDTEIEANYPAFYYAKNYGTAAGIFSDGWYLPSKAELQKIYEKKDDLKAVCKLCGLDRDFSKDAFWSASLSSSYYDGAFKLNFEDGNWTNPYKGNYASVCAVREFKSAKSGC